VEPLTFEQQRVLGCLIEKQRTVPDSYPMTLNAVRSACNQSSNRDPVVSMSELDVQHALDGLKAAHLLRFVHPAMGERATKFRQVLDEQLGLDDAAMAVMSLLLVRGTQTSGELRTRADRLHAFASLDEVESTLSDLAGREQPLVVELPRRPGERQTRWAHLLGGDVVEDAGPVSASGGLRLVDQPAPTAAPTQSAQSQQQRSDDLVDELRAQVAALAERIARLERELGLAPG